MTDYYERVARIEESKLQRKSQMEEYSFTPPEPSIQDNLRNTKMQQAAQYATGIIEANKECFIAQWVMQNQDKNIDDYVLCYSYRGEAMKFWLEEKNRRSNRMESFTNETVSS